MKKLNLSGIAGMAASALLLACASANATPNTLSITVDENGNYSSSPSGAISGYVMGINHFTDTGSYLTYEIANLTPGLVPVDGALYIYDDAAHTVLSDIIVFEANGPSYIYFLSFDSNGDLADVGSGAAIPSWITALTVTNAVTEGANGVTVYTPTGPNGPLEQPGFTDNYTVTYTFESSGVPDGGTTIALLGMGLLGISALRRKLSR